MTHAGHISPTTIEIIQTGSITNKTFYAKINVHGTTSFDIKATDSSGITSVCSFLIDTVDVIRPVVTCPPFRSDTTLVGKGYRSFVAVPFQNLLPAPFDNAIGETFDPAAICTYKGTNCLIISSTIPGTPSGQLNADINGQRKNYSVSLFVTDSSGNQGVCMYNEEVYDNEQPKFNSKFRGFTSYSPYIHEQVHLMHTS